MPQKEHKALKDELVQDHSNKRFLCGKIGFNKEKKFRSLQMTG